MTVQSVRRALLAGVVILGLATLLEEGSISYVSVDSVRPDIVLLLVIDWSLLAGIESGMAWGLVGGIFVDVFSGLPFGTSSMAYLGAAAVAVISERAFSRAHVLLPVVAAFVATCVYYAIAFVIVASANHAMFLGSGFLGTVLGVAIFNAVLNPFLYWFAQNLDTRLTPVARTIL